MAKTPVDRFADARTWVTALSERTEGTTASSSEPAVSAAGAESPNPIAAAPAPRQSPPSSASAGSLDSIAVVPLANLSGDPSQEFFVAGMHDAIISELAKIGALTVISRRSMMQFKDSTDAIPEIAEKLGVEAVIEGSVLQAGDRVRISLQLMQADPEKHLWTDTYERDVTDVLALHGDVARAVADAVTAKLTTDEIERLSGTEIVDPEAYELYLRGRHLSAIMEVQSARRIEFFEKAIERAPDFAAAHASLARTLLWRTILGMAAAGPAVARARAAVARALELDPDSGEALAAAGYLKTMADWDPRQGIRDLRRAVELEPNNVEALHDLAWCLSVSAQFDEAIDTWKRGQRVDPFAPLMTNLHGWTLYLARRWQDSVDVLAAGVEAHPDFPHMWLWLGAALERAGYPDRAREALRRAEYLDPGDSNLDLFAVCSIIYRRLGDDEDVARANAAIRRHADRPDIAWFESTARWTSGDLDGACRQLKRCEDDQFPMAVLLPVHPGFEPIMGHPGIREIATRIGERLGLDPPVPILRYATPAEVVDATPAASIAVLPFVSMSPDPEDEYLADGISEDIMNALARVPDLKVAARTSAFSFRGTDEGLRVVGERLGVATVLEGSVRRAGKRLRITAQLVGVEDGYQLWSERYDRELEDVFAVQDEIAENIASRLEVTLGIDRKGEPSKVTGASKSIGTASVPAYEAYMKGRYLWYQRTPMSMAAATDCFEEAIALDPDFAAAYCGLADCYSVRRAGGYVSHHETAERAGFAARKALALAPDTADAQVTAAYYESYYGDDWPAAEAHWLQAIEYDPVLPVAHVQYSLFLSCHRRRDEAHRHSAKARELDPLSPFVAMLEGMGRYTMGDYEDAVSSADAATVLQVDFPLALIFGGLSLARLGRHAEGIARLEKGVEMTRRIPIFVGMLGYARSLAGDPDGARSLLAEIEDRGRMEYVSPIAAVLLEMGLGDLDALEAALRVALDDRMPPITMSLLPPDHVAELGRSPRFAELFRELRLPAYVDGGE
jgi:TolB-like protein/Flp pilus assembly protein TadD